MLPSAPAQMTKSMLMQHLDTSKQQFPNFFTHIMHMHICIVSFPSIIEI